MRRPKLLLPTVIVFLATVPSSVQAQQEPTASRFWVEVGLGGGLFEDLDGIAAVAEIAYQKESHLVALHAAAVAEILGDGIAHVGILYGRATAVENTSASIAAGLAIVDVADCPGGLSSGPCDGRTKIGLPIVAETAFQPASFFGIGIQGFANLNSAQSFVGGAVVLRFGSLR